MENSHIQWTDHTFNPWIGCTKVAPECKFCYAEEQQDHRYGRVKWGKGNPRHRTSKTYWLDPLKWNEEAKQSGIRRKVFCCSLADVFDSEIDYSWRLDLFELIESTGYLDWLLLTKRPQNVAPMIAELAVPMCELWDCEKVAPGNVWLGVSAGVDPAPMLKVPAVIHFLSCEPMLQKMTGIDRRFDWVIFGGESGRNARFCDPEWIKLGVQLTEHIGAAPFVKQLGSNCGLNLKHTKGGEMAEWPIELQKRSFPRL